MIQRNHIINLCNETLNVIQFKDYAPNGLQVEGTDGVNKIVTAVTASRAAIEFAAQQNAHMLLVHHGMFWKSEPITITGWKKERIAALLNHNINLVGYHLPLDAHAILGNNAQLAYKMGWQIESVFGEQNLLNIGYLPDNQRTGAQLMAQIEQVLQHKPIVIGDVTRSIKRIVWCTGGAQGYFQQAIEKGADVYVTGEISEAQYHLANETGVLFISAGHHATERFGIQALGAYLTQQLGVSHQFFDEPNPA